MTPGILVPRLAAVSIPTFLTSCILSHATFHFVSTTSMRHLMRTALFSSFTLLYSILIHMALISAADGSYIGLQCLIEGMIALGTVFIIAARFTAWPSLGLQFRDFRIRSFFFVYCVGQIFTLVEVLIFVFPCWGLQHLTVRQSRRTL